MKPISPLYVVLAGAALLTPFWSPVAQAIDIKVRPAVKVQPKIKPKIKISPKVAVRPKIKIAPKIAVKPRIKPQIRVAKPQIKVPSTRVKPRIAVTPKFKAVPLPAQRIIAAPSIPKLKPQVKLQPNTNFVKAKPSSAAVPLPAPRASTGNLKSPNLGNRAGRIARDAGAREAVTAAETARNVVGMKELRDTAGRDLGLNTPALGGDGPLSNQDRLGGAPGKIARGQFGFGDDLGGSTHIPGPENSHNGKTPGNPFAVTPESIAQGMAGANGQGTVRLPIDKRSIFDRNEYSSPPGGNGSGVFTVDQVKTRPDGSSTIIHVENNAPDNQTTRQVIQRDENGRIIEDTGPQPTEAHTTTTELRNPDHDTGDPNCRTIDCIVNPPERKGLKMEDLNVDRVFKPEPEHANANTRTGPPIVTQDQLLSNYDPDSRANNAGGAQKLQDVCMHSEC